MIEEYVKILESFKQNQISIHIQSVYDKILAILESKHVSPLITGYFTTIKAKKEPLTGYECELFTDYEREPDNISQIKKLLNALYYLRLTFVDLEDIDVRNYSRTYSDLSHLYTSTIDKAYEASCLVTHLDLDLKNIFSAELATLLPLLRQVQTIAENQSQKTTDVLKSDHVPYKLGEITGIAADQMRPLGGDVDYNFLTQFSAELPNFISQLAQQIREYSSQIKKHEPKLNKEKLNVIQNAALHLLNDIEHLQRSHFFISLNYLKYIQIVRNIIILSMSSLEQMGEFSESLQDLLRDKLAHLKYELLPPLFGLVDKIEVNTMLKPGTLSGPLMAKVTSLYDALLYFPLKMVDFKKRGAELLSIRDSRFTDCRLEFAYQRIDTAAEILYKTQKAKEASTEFFSILNNPLYKNSCIHQLPYAIKQQLIQHYKLIKPYMARRDIDLNNLIIDSLLGPESWYSYVNKPFNWATNNTPADYSNKITALQDDLTTLIIKSERTQLFQIELIKDLIQAERDTNIHVYPHSEQTNIYTIDESTIALIKVDTQLKFIKEKTNTILDNSKQLNATQAQTLHLWYDNKYHKLKDAELAYHTFTNLLKAREVNGGTFHLQGLDEGLLETCRKLYNTFQPYFVNSAPDIHQQNIRTIDAYFVAALYDTNADTEKAPSTELFLTLKKQLQTCFTSSSAELHTKSQEYLSVANTAFKVENNAATLKRDPEVLNDSSAWLDAYPKLQSITPTVIATRAERLAKWSAGNRSHHLLSHTNYSKGIDKFRHSLFEVQAWFNQPMRDALVPKSSGVPFPEMENKNLQLAQSEQVRAIKDLYNSLYHLEGIVLELEQLNMKSSRVRYVQHLWKAYTHINEIIQLCTRLNRDPHFSFIAHELLSKAQILYATFQEHSEAYQVAPGQIASAETLKYNPLWYIINAFYIGPQHIKALKNNGYIEPVELNELQAHAKQASLTIETAINNASNYFKLFLQTPRMIALYQELTAKLNDFTSTTHDAVLNNLGNARKTLFTPMLLEADHWEAQLGLQPGKLSEPLRQIINEYFKGLLHPLKLHSNMHLGLVCDQEPVNTRIELVQQKIKDMGQKTSASSADLKDIKELYERMRSHPASAKKVPADAEIIRETYHKVLPKLAKLKLDGKVHIPASTNDPDHRFDTLCNAQLKEGEPRFTEAEAWVSASYHYHLGLNATQMMSLDGAKNKLTYLLRLKVAQRQEDQEFIKDYTTESYYKRLEVLCNRHIGLHFMKEEYQEKLNAYLKNFEESIIEASLTAEDINLSIQKLLQDQISIFEKSNFSDYYQLDRARTIMYSFTSHFDKHPNLIVDENGLKSSPNTKAIQTLETILKQKLPVKERLEQIKKAVASPVFESHILAQAKKNPLSLAYLKQCFLNLLKVLHLYTPPKVVLLNNLRKTVNESVNVASLANQFGLFASASARELELPVMPNAAPAV